MNLTASEASQLGKLVDWLGQACSEHEIRSYVGEQMLRLLKADYFASFSWNETTRSFGDCIALNMGLDNLAAYETYYQYRDPITPGLQQRRVPTLVTEIMPQDELVKTEFFNDFLWRDGLYHGVNVYAYDGDRNIGDMRIWRGKKRKPFDDTTLLMLSIVEPVFTSALKRARARQGGAAARAAGLALRCLSERERSIALGVYVGLCDKKIAQQLDIEFSTVRTHLARIFQKFGVHSRTQLIQCMIDHSSHGADVM